MRILVFDTKEPDFGDAAISLILTLIIISPGILALRAAAFDESCAAWSEPKPSIQTTWIATPEGGFPIFGKGKPKVTCAEPVVKMKPWAERLLQVEE